MFNCPKCSTQFSRKGHFYRHVKRCGTDEYRVSCPYCPKTFSRKDAMKRHLKKHPDLENKSHKCPTCQKSFRHQEHLLVHQRSCGTVKKFKCPHPGCNKRFTRKAFMEHHRDRDHQSGSGLKRKLPDEEPVRRKYLREDSLPESVTVKSMRADKEVRAAKGVKVEAYFYPQTKSQQRDLKIFLNETFPRLENRLEDAVENKKGVKWNLVLHCKMEMPGQYSDQPKEYSPYFQVGPFTSTHEGGLSKQIQVACERLEDRMDSFSQSGSGWTLKQVHEIQLHMADYAPFRGSSFLKLHPYIKNKKAVVNVKNDDQECFKWSVLAALHSSAEHPERISKYREFDKELNFDGMEFPITVDAISKFETLNPTISISVIGYEQQKGGKVELFPVRLMKEKKDHHITLLYWSKGGKSHYAWVKSLNRLLADQTKNIKNKFYCERCFHGFSRSDLLEKHLDYCKEVPAQRTEMVDKIIQFNNVQYTEPTLFRVYADFECVLKKIEEQRGDKAQRVQKHIPCGYAWALVSNHPDIASRAEYYSPKEEEFIVDEVEEDEEEKGKEVISHFFESLTELEEELVPYLKENKPVQLSNEDWIEHDKADHCCICQEPFTEEDFKVRDHDHATGEYRGAAHRTCNLQKKRKVVIPIFIHNLRDYDAHLIMRGIHQYAEEKRINVIPNNMEHYVSFSLGPLRFLDSFQFMASSLSSLANNLEDYPHLEELFPTIWSDFDEEDLKLLTRKGVYPYSYMDSFSKFHETSLPSKDAFFSDLTGEDISDEEYSRAQQVWSTFHCQSLQVYHDLYLLTDILLLADVFENFRSICLETYQLDPAHYYTAPGLAWDAALKYTQVQLATLVDVSQHLFIEQGMRGGISMITHRHAQANHPLLEDYNPEKPSSYILYLDANNLYGWAMSQPLPVSDFQWVQDPSSLNVLEIPDDSEDGYILEVDLEYPPHLHDSHNDYPLAPETMAITSGMLSPYSQQLAEELKLKMGGVKKLTPNLQDKEK